MAKAPTSAQRSEEPNKTLRLPGSIARDIGVRIVSGRYGTGHILDGEILSSERLQVSRTVYREAVHILAAKGLVESRTKVGTRVCPEERWHLLDPDVLAWIFASEPKSSILHALSELRSIVDPSAAALAAVRRTQQDLDSMRRALGGMALCTRQTADRERREFHAAVFRATCNPFFASLSNAVTGDLTTPAVPPNRDPAPDYARVYDAIAAKDAAAARRAMAELIGSG